MGKRKRYYQEKFGKTNYYQALDDIDNAGQDAKLELDKAIILNNEIVELLEIITNGLARSSHFPEKSPVIVALMTLASKFMRLQNIQARSRKALEPVELSLDKVSDISEQVLDIINKIDELNNEHINNEIDQIINDLD